MKRIYNLKFFRQKEQLDMTLLILVFVFTAFGLLMIYEASNFAAFQTFSDKYRFVKDQSLWALAGFILLFILSRIHYRKYFQLSVPLMAVSIVTLIAVLIPGIGTKALGARRWITLGSLNFQPSELVKLSLILYLSAWLSSREKGRFTSFILLLSIIVGLVVLQPDLGTAVVLTGIFLVVYFISKAPLWHFAVLMPLAVLSVLGLAVFSPYRYQRLMTFFDPNSDPLGASYHFRQILISLGSGGIKGLGLGASRQKYQFLPEATTDSIFAIIGEEFGFIGTFALIIVYVFLLWRIFLIVRDAPDKFSYLLSAGILSLLGLQIIINLGAMVAVFPLTGIPLPFISYGGSNLIVTLCGIGMILNISKYTKPKK